jgi:glutamyl-tRNA synthetase
MSLPGDVRVRIAPSPTGDPHVGTAYVGLFNMVFARSRGGRFVLRIEDTDQVRSTAASEQAILDSLKWLGLRWDEGPDVGGPAGPYRQSERTEIYREHVAALIDKGAAYRCFCTPERLTQVRAELRAAGADVVAYDRHCRDLDPADGKRRANAGEPHVVRMKMPIHGETVIRDHLRGAIHRENRQVDDQVLLKSDGFPTYHLANVVDDHLMGITHVIRAEEWIPSTPKHVVLYEAFGWEPPVFVHLSLLRNADKSKISKRKNPVSLSWYREAGFLPEALLNFLGLMGWSLGEDKEIFGLEEMVEEFDLDRLKVSEPVFDLTKLEWLNGQYMRDMPTEELAERVRRFLVGERLERAIPLLQPRLPRLDAYVEQAAYFYGLEVPFEIEGLKIKRWPGKEEDGGDQKALLRALRKALADLLELVEKRPVWDTASYEELLRGYCEGSGWKPKELFMAVRVAVTGRKASPPLFETMEALGKARVQYRLRRAVEALRAALR